MTLVAPLLDIRVRGRIAPWVVAGVISGIAIALRMAMEPILPQGYPFLAFFPAVILSTFLCGRGPGIFAASIGGMAAWYLFIPPLGSFKLDPPSIFALAFYFFVCAIDILLIDALQKRHGRLVASERRQVAMAEQQVLLFKELQHRVANNLAAISAMLRLQRRQIERSPERAGAIMASADTRIDQMGRVHRLLYDPAAPEIPSIDHIERTVAQIVEVTGRDNVTITVEGDRGVRLETGRMLTLALLVGEFVTNSLKHGYEPGARGRIAITLLREPQDQVVLRVTDDGRGTPGGTPPARSGLGTAIIAGLVRQIEGELETDGSSGMRCEVRFPES